MVVKARVNTCEIETGEPSIKCAISALHLKARRQPQRPATGQKIIASDKEKGARLIKETLSKAIAIFGLRTLGHAVEEEAERGKKSGRA